MTSNSQASKKHCLMIRYLGLGVLTLASRMLTTTTGKPHTV